MADDRKDITAALVDAVRGLRYANLPAEAKEVARHCVLDLVGVTIAGAREPLVEMLVDVVARAERASEAGLIGREERATRATAALVNGAAGHALDFDDTNTSMMGHPTVPVLPALLALAEGTPVRGSEVVTALVAGIELECRLAALLGTAHYDVGFHSTATLGTFGAAAACAHLLGLDGDAWLRAMGLAGTEAAGLKSAFGTMAKPLHAGRAASAGLLAAKLAERGFTAATDVIEAKQGFAATHAGALLDRDVLDRLAGRFLVRDTLFKYHASCYLTHAPIEAARRIRLEDLVSPASIEAIEIRVAPSLLGVCNIPEPRTGLEGKFSVRATVALGLLGRDTADLSTYCESVMADAAVLALRDRTRVVTDAGYGPTRATVTVTAAGRRHEAEADSGTPSVDLPDQRRRLRAKFDALVVPILGATRASKIAEAALGIDAAASVEPLLAAVSRGSGGEKSSPPR
jgi:2-methylcitrate dehydratase PrpD